MLCSAQALYSVVAGVAELADAQDLKSCGPNRPYRFDSGRRHRKKAVVLLGTAAFLHPFFNATQALSEFFPFSASNRKPGR